jgi:hypothetical protein
MLLYFKIARTRKITNSHFQSFRLQLLCPATGYAVQMMVVRTIRRSQLVSLLPAMTYPYNNAEPNE